jgi:hypothetical protein
MTCYEKEAFTTDLMSARRPLLYDISNSLNECASSLRRFYLGADFGLVSTVRLPALGRLVFEPILCVDGTFDMSPLFNTRHWIFFCLLLVGGCIGGAASAAKPLEDEDEAGCDGAVRYLWSCC